MNKISNVLLERTASSFDLSLNRPMIKTALNKVMSELRSRGFRYFRPKFFLGSEWYSPEGKNSIAIPFFLVDEQLRNLEKELMGEVEGGTEDKLLKLIRHEVGHAFDHAYGLSSLPRWQELFGDPSAPYHPHNFQFKPYSRRYVKHLPGFYSQAHPSEDFAETFAVWLAFSRRGRRLSIYSAAIDEKIKYLDKLADKYRFKRPLSSSIDKIRRDEMLDLKLKKIYRMRIRELGPEHRFYYDACLKKVFASTRHGEKKRCIKGKDWIYVNLPELQYIYQEKSKRRSFETNLLFKRLAQRASAMNLYADQSRPKFTKTFVTSLLKYDSVFK